MAVVDVSAVIPCFNGEAYLGEAIDSVLSQTARPFEVLVVDDGSLDRSAAIAESFGPPVTVIRQLHRGESRARNRGFEEASGRWIAFLDADDRWEPTKIERQLRWAASDVVCIHTNYYCFQDSDARHDLSRVPPAERYRLASLCAANPFHLSSAMVRRSVVARFPEWTGFAEDLIFLLDLLREGRFAFEPQVLAAHRRHPGQQTNRPDIEVRWFEAIDDWLIERRPLLAADDWREARQAMAVKLQQVSDRAERRGDSALAAECRRVLAARPEIEAHVPAHISA